MSETRHIKIDKKTFGIIGQRFRDELSRTEKGVNPFPKNFSIIRQVALDNLPPAGIDEGIKELMSERGSDRMAAVLKSPRECPVLGNEHLPTECKAFLYNAIAQTLIRCTMELLAIEELSPAEEEVVRLVVKEREKYLYMIHEYSNAANRYGADTKVDKSGTSHFAKDLERLMLQHTHDKTVSEAMQAALVTFSLFERSQFALEVEDEQ